MAHDTRRTGGGILLDAAPAYQKLCMAIEQTQDGPNIINIVINH